MALAVGVTMVRPPFRIPKTIFFAALFSLLIGVDPLSPVDAADLRVYTTPQQQAQAKNMLYAHIDNAVARSKAQRQRELDALKTPQEWRRRQAQTRARLEEYLGQFGPKCPLLPRVVGKLDRPDYVIEKIIFQSQPNYHCTCNLYLPKKCKGPLPGVLFTCGHLPEGKGSEYHECALGLVKKGYVVLALDPIGQGERSEYFDPKTGKDLVPLTVSQHHYVARPSWLVGRTLIGYRVLDCVRALDYLEKRPEVNPEQLAVVGNSGGGQMALSITAADPRIKVCVAAHPAGSMEQTYLNGQYLSENEFLSLVPPRPCLIIVGKDSGEAPYHQSRLDDMLQFYKGLGVADRAKLVIVDGRHDMKKPKREAAYPWLARWFGREGEDGKEHALEPEPVENLWCSKSGRVVQSLGGETAQTLNAKLAEKLRPPRPAPKDKPSLETARTTLKNKIDKRIGLRTCFENGVRTSKGATADLSSSAISGQQRSTLLDKPAVAPIFNHLLKQTAPEATALGSIETGDLNIDRLVLKSEPGIELPALLLKPKKSAPDSPLVLHVAELGKPTDTAQESLALRLACQGCTVFSVDVRGTGETDPRDRAKLPSLIKYNADQFHFASHAVRAARMQTTMAAMRAYDVIRAVDYLRNQKEFAKRPIVLAGEGLGGVWALIAAVFDTRTAGVICVDMVPSYKLIVGSQYYNARDYFWVPGALKDFDLPDLVGLVAPRSTLLVNPRDALLKPLEQVKCQDLCAWARGVYSILDKPQGLQVINIPEGKPAQTVEQIASTLNSWKH
ncbi:MAG: acetylxylan esterase [Pirellulales bacterium]|nr:acetylxylan esterase [Pirellulales bacterium]